MKDLMAEKRMTTVTWKTAVPAQILPKASEQGCR